MSRYYAPFHTLNQLQREVNRLFDASPAWGQSTQDGAELASGDWLPAVDVREDADRFVIYADIPGVDPQDIEITLDNGVLTLKGQRKTFYTENQQGYHRTERSSGSFLRRFTLPNTVDIEKVSARSENGVLELVIPKNQQSQVRKIAVTA
ncbi:Hsp20/alpha crystallin family protein [Candidatus Nitrosacidococcus tergens]|uniref:Heat shock protein Hsp20 n=1 Tax=Candidatus Nitrosacidococcus tergens TaxID=553981 RepID=A0A7G1Q8Y9_9GAMM|nr:Hsp20/alpha crystallin family protein [Candidatus Nitrosacidococcus tergens]CAB1275022.1 Heat shock protein Hsp20 [Candidatus Nitrosacidococcus tergens]